VHLTVITNSIVINAMDQELDCLCEHDHDDGEAGVIGNQQGHEGEMVAIKYC